MSYYRGGGGRGRGGGRGDYYKNKYGNGGGRGGDSYYGNGGGGRGDSYGNGGRGDYGNGGGGGGSRGGWSSPQPPPIATQPLYGDFNNPATGGGSYFDLEKALTNMDGKPYGAYHELDTPYPRGWVNKARKFTLYIEKAQSDPFASPTRCRIEVDSRRARIPVAFTSNKIRRVAVGDFLLRTMYENIKRMGMDSELPSSGWSGPKGGEISILEPCQHVLEQSAVYVDKYGQVKAQFTINLPARGRNIMGEAAWEIFDQKLPDIIESSLIYDALDPEAMDFHVKSVEDQAWLRDVLASRKLVGFIPNGAILPRVSGADDRPMQSSPIRFKSPKEFEVSFRLPNGGTELFGMGIPKGITLICGGGFHGKSTLLTALEYGIYPKVPGDGREFCAAAPKAVKIRAEDGRAVEAVDISTFIHNLPFGRETTCFSTPDASGSTSQAANIIEVSRMIVLLSCG
jgi:predicted ABC-class ATPase